MIAADLVMTLRGLGIEGSDSVSNVTDALEYLKTQRPDAALLDVNLGTHRETSADVADRLSELGIPFFFISGYVELAQMNEAHRDVPHLTKPVSEAKLVEELSRIVRDKSKSRA